MEGCVVRIEGDVVKKCKSVVKTVVKISLKNKQFIWWKNRLKIRWKIRSLKLPNRGSSWLYDRLWGDVTQFSGQSRKKNRPARKKVDRRPYYWRNDLQNSKILSPMHWYMLFSKDVWFETRKESERFKEWKVRARYSGATWNCWSLRWLTVFLQAKTQPTISH